MQLLFKIHRMLLTTGICKPRVREKNLKIKIWSLQQEWMTWKTVIESYNIGFREWKPDFALAGQILHPHLNPPLSCPLISPKRIEHPIPPNTRYEVSGNVWIQPLINCDQVESSLPEPTISPITWMRITPINEAAHNMWKLQTCSWPVGKFSAGNIPGNNKWDTGRYPILIKLSNITETLGHRGKYRNIRRLLQG